MKRIAWLIVIALWAFIGVSGLMARPVFEDYCYATFVRDLGVFGTVQNRYTEWAGRYSQQTVHAVLAQWEPYGGQIGAPILLAVLVLAWWYAISKWYPRRDALLLSLALCGALIMSRPDDTPLVWLEGMATYLTTVAGWGLLIAALARKKMVLAAAIAFIAVAFSEIGGAVIVAGLGLLLLFWRGERRWLGIVLASALFGLAVLLIAPGNSVRASVRPETVRDFGYLARIALASFATTIIVTAIWAFPAGLFVSGVGAILPPPFETKRIPLILIGLVLLVTAGISILGALIFGWSFSEWVFFLIQPFWVALWFFMGALIGRSLKAWRWFTLVGVLLVVSAANFAVDRISYAQRWDARHGQILANYRVPGYIGEWDTLTPVRGMPQCAQAWYGHPIRTVDDLNVP